MGSYYIRCKLFYIILVAIFVIFFSDALYAAATADNSIAKVVCNVVNELTGPIGQAVSTVAVIFIGIGLFMGKISWGLALGIAVGMAMLFGAENVVGWISGSPVHCEGGKVFVW